MKKDISTFQAAFAGGTAGAITRAVAQPLDVLKIRFQLQLEPFHTGSKYSSIRQATTSIIKEEGLFTLWSGHIPAQWLSISFGLIQFSTFEKLVQFSSSADHESYEHNKHKINFVSGAIASTIAIVISFPFDTVRTRLIAEEKTHKAYKGFINAFVTMVKVEGPFSLFKGLLPTLSMTAPHAGIQFAVYKLCTENIFKNFTFLHRQGSAADLTTMANAAAGSMAGFASKTAIYPFDLLKKRLQIQGFQEHRKSFGRQMYCNGLINCIQLTVKMEGVLALYKGFGPSILKAMLVSALHFSVYDEIKHFILKL